MDHLCMKCGICVSGHYPMCYPCGGGYSPPLPIPNWYDQEIQRLKRQIQTLEDELRSRRRHVCPDPWYVPPKPIYPPPFWPRNPWRPRHPWITCNTSA